MSYAELVMLPAHTLGSTASFALAETGMSLRQPESHSAIQQAPNPSIERTSSGKPRLPAAAAHVERWATRGSISVPSRVLSQKVEYGTK